MTGVDWRDPEAAAASATSGLGDFIEEFMTESDRAAVVLVAAKLDYLLRQAITARLLPCPGKDDLLEGDAPLSTFSARIKCAHRLGIIDADFARYLTIFRRMRNDFAHSPHGAGLDSGANHDRLEELTAPIAGTEYFNDLSAQMGGRYTEARIKFIAFSGLMVSFLRAAIDRTERVSSDRAMHYGIPAERAHP